MVSIATKINNSSIQLYVYCRQILPFLILGLIISMVISPTSYAAGVNHLDGLKDDVGATFGAGSDMQYYILLFEGIAGAYAYSKTKSYAALVGVPVLMMFTHFALK